MDEGRLWGEKGRGERIGLNFPSSYPSQHSSGILPSVPKLSDETFKTPLISPINSAQSFPAYPDRSSYSFGYGSTNPTAHHGLEKPRQEVKAKLRHLAESRSKIKDTSSYDGVPGLHRSLSDTKLHRQEYPKPSLNNEIGSSEKRNSLEMYPEMRSKSVTMLAKESSVSSDPINLSSPSRINGMIPGTSIASSNPSQLNGLSRSWGSMHDLGSALHGSQDIHHKYSSSLNERYKSALYVSKQKMLSEHMKYMDMYSKSSFLGPDKKDIIQDHQSKNCNKPEISIEKLHKKSEVPTSTFSNSTSPLNFKQNNFSSDSYSPYLGTPIYPHKYPSNPYVMNGLMNGDQLRTEKINKELQKRKKKEKNDILDGSIPKKKKKPKTDGKLTENSQNGPSTVKWQENQNLGNVKIDGLGEDLSKDVRKSLQASPTALLQMQAKVHKLLNIKCSNPSESHESTKLSSMNGLQNLSSPLAKDMDFSKQPNLKWNMDIISPNKTVNDIPPGESNQLPKCCDVCIERQVRYSPQCLNKSSPNLFTDRFSPTHINKSHSEVPKSTSDLSLSKSELPKSSENGNQTNCENKIEELIASAIEQRIQKRDKLVSGTSKLSLDTNKAELSPELHSCVNSNFALSASGMNSYGSAVTSAVSKMSHHSSDFITSTYTNSQASSNMALKTTSSMDSGHSVTPSNTGLKTTSSMDSGHSVASPAFNSSFKSDIHSFGSGFKPNSIFNPSENFCLSSSNSYSNYTRPLDSNKGSDHAHSSLHAAAISHSGSQKLNSSDQRPLDSTKGNLDKADLSFMGGPKHSHSDKDFSVPRRIISDAVESPCPVSGSVSSTGNSSSGVAMGSDLDKKCFHSPHYSCSNDYSKSIERSTSLNDLRTSTSTQNSTSSIHYENMYKEEHKDIIKQEPSDISQNVLISSSEAEKENIYCSEAAKFSSSDHHSKPSDLPSLSVYKSESTDGFSKGDIKMPEDKLEHLAWVADRVQKLKSMITNEDHLDRLKKNIKVEIPKCNCKGPDYVVNEDLEGPYYTHLGTARSIQAAREIMEKRTGVTGKALRLEKIRYTGKEGKSSRGCPIAKWIIRRSGPEEKYLCVVRHRQGHYCETACIIIVIVAWEGVEKDTANDMYSYLVSNLTKNGFETERRCGTNERRTCACQGVDLNKRGASFSFGCSWSMYFNGCKFARSREVRKFKLKDTSQESSLETRFQNLATAVGPLYKQLAPDAYDNQIQFDEVAKACRLGHDPGRPFSGVTACVDFCAHAHKDLHNMNNGSTVVVTLTKHRGFDKPQDEQLHVLPLYVMDLADDKGSMEETFDQIRTGALEVLQQYPLEARIRSEPLTPCKKRGKQKKAGKESPASKKGSPVTPKNKVPASPQGKLKDSSTYQNHSASDLYFHHPSDKNVNSDKPPQPSKLVNNDKDFKDQQQHENKKRVMSYDDMAVSDKMHNQALYESFWNYFNCFGTFPPPSFINSWAVQRKGFTAPNSDTLPKDFSGKYDNAHSSLHSYKHEPSSSNKEDMLTKESSSSSQKSLFQQPDDIRFNGAFNKSGKESSQHQEKQKETGGEVPLDLSSSGSSLDLKSSFDLMNGQIDSETRKSSDSHGNGSMGGNSVREGTAEGFQSPLHLLSEAVFLRTKDANEENRQQSNFSDKPSDLPQSLSKGDNSVDKSNIGQNHYLNHENSPYGSSMPHSIHKNMDNHAAGNTMFNNHMNKFNNVENINSNSPLNAPFTNNISNAEEPSLDPTVVKCELEYNKEAFLDQEMGGVAIALQHGAVLFEVAKRELHATTGLRNPNRFAPTRISLVFYQHKNLNRASHGWYEYEQKLQMLKQSRLEKMNDKNSILPALDLPNPPPLELLRKKKKGKKSDKDDSKEDLKKMPSVEYKYLWEGPLRRAVSLTTDSVITRWIDPQPMVTGPYQRWV